MPPPPTRRNQRGSHRYERDGWWWAYLSGRRPPRVALGTRDPAEAERRFRARLAGDDRGAAGAAATREATMTAVLEAWLDEPHGWTRRTLQTQRDRVLAVGAWLEANGVRYPGEVTAELLARWLTARSKAVSRRTVNRDLRALRVCLRWAAERGLCAPCGPVAARKGLREARRSAVRYVPSRDELAAVCVHLTPDGARDAVLALYGTGLRIEELRRLVDSDVRGGAVHVRPEAGPAATAAPTKGYRERAVPCAEAVLGVVRAFLAWRLRGKGGQGKAAGCSESWLLRRLHAACADAGVPRFGLHDLRAAFATEAVDAGIGLSVVQRWLGHADVQTTQGYVRPRRSDATIQAPADHFVHAYKTGAVGGGLERDCPPASSPQHDEIAATPGRVELPTNGLGNRARPATPQPKSAADCTPRTLTRRARGSK